MSTPEIVPSSAPPNAAHPVAQHYNALQEKGKEFRKTSRIFRQRNLNNWMKSCLIADFLEKVRESFSTNSISVLDLCCGKGGDLLKWKIGKIGRLVCADIADVSLDQCRDRYKEMESRQSRFDRLFTAEFFHADCSTERLQNLYKNTREFHLCSCQFSLHYSFASLEQARCMLRNACESLCPGGFFIATIPNANYIVSNMKHQKTTRFGNDVYSIEFDPDNAEKLNSSSSLPLFGAKYHFKLEDVVDCPEYLVHLPLLIEMLRELDMDLLFAKTFPQILNEYGETREGKNLLSRMNALETFPPDEAEEEPFYSDAKEYAHAKKEYDELVEKEGAGAAARIALGTISRSEWEVVSLYMAVAFRKKRVE